MVMESLPPHDIEAEEAVIAAMLVSDRVPLEVGTILKADDFFRDKNGFIFDAAMAVWARNEAVNQITVSHELQRQEKLEAVGGTAYLSGLVSDLPTALGAADHARIVARDATYRRLISFAGEVASLAYKGGPDLGAVLGEVETKLRDVTRRGGSDGTTTLAEMSPEKEEHMLLWAESPHEASRSISTGLSTLDDHLTGGGLLPGKLYTIGGATGMGKSSFMRWVLKNQAQAGHRVLLLSLEQDKDEVWEEIAYAIAAVDPQEHERYGTPLDTDERERLESAIQFIREDMDIFHINDRSRLTPAEARMIIGKIKSQHPDLAVVGIDYLHLFQPNVDRKGENAEERLSQIATELRDTCKEFNVACLLASQLTKEVMDRRSNDDLRPKLRHFRGTGAITQLSYCVLGLFSEDYCVRNGLMDPDPSDLEYFDGGERYRPKNTLDVSVLKQQRGQMGVNVKLGFWPNTRQIADIEEE